MGMNFRPPASTGGQDDVKALYSYLFQLAEQLNVAFENVDAQGGGVAYKAMQMAGGTALGEVDATTAEAYQNLKALIIKTATQVTSNIRKQYLDLAQEYIAQSEYGTYAEFLQAQIELGADGVVANWDQTNMITTSVADFNEYIAQSDIYMQIGIVRENQDGTMEAGVVVGKNFQKVTIDGVETITSKDVYMLLTAEQISFWQDGVKRSSLSLEDFFVNKAYIDEVQTSLISSKTFGEELDISSNSSIELLNDRLSLIVSSESSETSLVLTDTALTAIANNIDLTANESIKTAVENANEGLKTEIEQTSDRLSLIVKSESTATNLELTDQMAAVISEEVKLVAGTPDSLQNSSVTINQNMVAIETPVFSVQNESTGMTLDEEGLSAEYVSAPNLAEKYTGKASVTVGGGASADVKLTAANFSEYFDILEISSGYSLSTAGGNLRLIPNNLGQDGMDAICTITAKKSLSYMEIWYRCKSESGHDTLYGNCNNATIISTVSGDHAYQRAWYGSVSAGDDFTFTYHKDNSTSVSGEEVYIDFISTISTGSGAEGDYKSLAALASELNGRLLAQNLKVTLVSDVTGSAEFANIAGGKISIEGNGYTVRGRMNIANCSAFFDLNGMYFASTGTEYSIISNSRVLMRGCTFNMSTPGGGPISCLFLEDGARLFAQFSDFYSDNGRIMTITGMSYCTMEACSGSTGGSRAFVVSEGSVLRAYDGYPSGAVDSTASVVELAGGETTGSTPPAPPSISEQTFTCTASDTCRGSSDWDGSGYIWQGYTSSVHRGYMWFSGLASAISGKTIVSATLKLTRVNGIGRSGATTLYAYYTTKTAASGTQSVSTAYGGELGSISNEETKVFDLPVEIIQRIADYGYGGIALYSGETANMEGRNYSRNYCKIYGAYSAYAPELTVTYQ